MAEFDPVPEATKHLSGAVVDAAYKVHSALGPGLLESVYEACLAHELKRRGIALESQLALPVSYDGIVVHSGLRLDMLVGDAVVVEIKAVERMIPLFEAQLLTYLKLTGRRVGLLLNFNVPLIKDGIFRFVL